MRMKPARLAVLGIALVAGIGAAVLASGSKPSEIVEVVAKAPVNTIVVAEGPLEYGTTLTGDNLVEAPWEPSIVPEGAFKSKADLLKDGARAVLTSVEKNELILSSRITGPNQLAPSRVADVWIYRGDKEPTIYHDVYREPYQLAR